jgi:hypothetical protein
MVGFCCVSSLFDTLEDTCFTIGTDLRIALFQVVPKLIIFTVIQRVVVIRGVLRNRSSKKVLVFEAVVAEQSIVSVRGRGSWSRESLGVLHTRRNIRSRSNWWVSDFSILSKGKLLSATKLDVLVVYLIQVVFSLAILALPFSDEAILPQMRFPTTIKTYQLLSTQRRSHILLH